MPKKALVRSIDVWNTINRGEEFGASVQNAKLDWPQVMARKDELIGKFVGGKKPYLKKMGVDYIEGEARFTSPETIQVGDQEYAAERFLIGTGSVPRLPAIEGIEWAKTNRDLLNLNPLPKSMVLVGGGVISLEFAHIYNSVGVDVTILQRGDVLLRTQDRETSDIIQAISEEKGIRVETGVNVQSIAKESEHYVVHYQQGDHTEQIVTHFVAMNVGRVPNVSGLDLEKANVEYDEKGISVNAYLQTSNERIYAGGDCIGGLMLTPKAAYDGKVAVRNAFLGNKEKVDYTLVPHAIFTSPPVASIGMTEDEARKKGVAFGTTKVPFTHNGTTILLGEEKGYAKILYEKQTGRLIGFHMVGVHADDIVHELAIAMRANMTIHELADVIQVHPTVSEAMIELAMEGAKHLLDQKKDEGHLS